MIVGYLVFVIAIILIALSNIWMIHISFKRDEEWLKRDHDLKMKILDDFEKDMKDMFDKGFDVSVDDEEKEK